MHDVKRDEQLRVWIRASEQHELLAYEDVVMWGVAFSLDDESRPPVAFFYTEAEADAYATLFNKQEWDVAPYVLTIQGRNNFEVPKAEGA